MKRKEAVPDFSGIHSLAKYQRSLSPQLSPDNLLYTFKICMSVLAFIRQTESAIL